MQTIPTCTSSDSRRGFIILPLLVGLVAMAATGAVSYFRLSSDTRALGDGLRDAIPGVEKKLAINVGPITAGLVRVGAGFFNLPDEPKAGVEAFHGAEVAIYELSQDLSSSDRFKVLKRADTSMSARGWTRLVGVVQNGNLVAVYLPREKLSLGRMRCCVMVLHERQAVLASARANLKPLIELAEKQGNLPAHFLEVASAGRR